MQININSSRKGIFIKLRENLKLKRQRPDGVHMAFLAKESPYIIVEDQMSTPTDLCFFSNSENCHSVCTLPQESVKMNERLLLSEKTCIIK